MNHQARPPRSPPLSEREKRLIKILHEDGAFAVISYADVARILNMVYRSDNQGCRTRDGVYSFLHKTTISLSLTQ